MTDPVGLRRTRLNFHPLDETVVPADHRRRAGRVVASRFPDDPLLARHILDVLGMLDLPRAVLTPPGEPDP